MKNRERDIATEAQRMKMESRDDDNRSLGFVVIGVLCLWWSLEMMSRDDGEVSVKLGFLRDFEVMVRLSFVGVLSENVAEQRSE